MNEYFPDIRIEQCDDGLILLEQDCGGEIHRVSIHSLYVRHLAEQLDLVEASDPQAQKTIAMLTRRLCKLRDEIRFLSSFMGKYEDGYRDDLRYEIGKADHIFELADEFCVDLPGAYPVPEWANCYIDQDENKASEKPKANPPQPQSLPASLKAKGNAEQPDQGSLIPEAT